VSSFIIRAIVGCLLVALLACGSEESTPVIIQTEGLVPTPTPLATPTPTPNIPATVQAYARAAVAAAIEDLATPTPTNVPTPDVTQGPIPTAVPTLVPTATPRPTPTPTPTPLPVIRPVAPPAVEAGDPQIFVVTSLSMTGRTLTLSGTIDGQGNGPTVIQIYQSLETAPYSETCSTERPHSFVQEGGGIGGFAGSFTDYDWTFCRDGYTEFTKTARVPWYYSQSWSSTMRDRKYIWDPHLFDFTMSVTLNYEKASLLEYSSAAGWRIIVYSGNRVIANRWLDY